MIPKADKDSRFPAHYHPVSLLSNFAKIAEKIIMTGLRNEIPEEQFGFGVGH